MRLSNLKILFVCHGNICRSVAAEYIMKQIVTDNNLQNNFYIDSAAATTEEIGNPIYRPMKDVLVRHNIKIGEHRARQIEKSDYQNFDYILCMDDENMRHLNRILGNDIDNKIYKLLNFSDRKGQNISDPWYTRDFEAAYQDIKYGIECFLKNKNILWICDNCGDYMNNQGGFTDWDGVWKCKKCGYLNDVTENNIK